MTFGSALGMVLIRRFRDSAVVLAGGATALQLSAVSWLMTDPLAVTRQDALLLALFDLSYAAALILWTEGTKLVTAAESGFLGTAETPFAMLLAVAGLRSEEHTSELQSLMRNSYAVFCLKQNQEKLTES